MSHTFEMNSEGFGSIVEPLVNGMFEVVFEIDTARDSISFNYISDKFLKLGIKASDINTYSGFCRVYSDLLVVKEEKQPVIDQLEMPVVLNEIDEKGLYFRTVHINYNNEVCADGIRIKEINGSGDRLLFSMTDITSILDRDWMTDEYSRTGFENAVREKLREIDLSEGYSIVYANIEGLKAINSIFGASTGDMFIFHERDVLRSILSPIVLSRFESDHFVLLTQTRNITEEAMSALASQLHEMGYQQYQFKILCGVYNIKSASEDIFHMTDCAKLAEKSLRSSSSGNYFVYDDRMNEEYVEKNVLFSELDDALANNEFKTFYQPIVDAKTHEIVAAESLVRWVHHSRGMIPPYKFVDVFEQRGLISKIDYIMARNVILFNYKRRREGKKYVPCSVNLSRVDFYDIRFMEKVIETIRMIQKVEDMVKFEVTESAYAILENNAIELLNEMQKINIQILLDDFGSGMSSMSTLESFDFDIIKLDMGFVRKIGISSKAENIIKAIINLSHSIGAKVVAEGVENKEQLDFLTEADCDMIQGYYFYKPMPEEEFGKLLDK